MKSVMFFSVVFGIVIVGAICLMLGIAQQVEQPYASLFLGVGMWGVLGMCSWHARLAPIKRAFSSTVIASMVVLLATSAATGYFLALAFPRVFKESIQISIGWFAMGTFGMLALTALVERIFRSSKPRPKAA